MEEDAPADMDWSDTHTPTLSETLAMPSGARSGASTSEDAGIVRRPLKMAALAQALPYIRSTCAAA